MPTKKNIKLEKIHAALSGQPRETLDEETIAQYAEFYTAGKKLPPLQITWDGTQNRLTDGFHRLAAATRAGLRQLPCEVKKGTPASALWDALGANQTHGLRLNRADKQRIVMLALESFSGQSDRAIAAHCGVSHTMVSTLRAELDAPPDTNDPSPNNEVETCIPNAPKSGAAKKKKIKEPEKNGTKKEPEVDETKGAFLLKRAPQIDNLLETLGALRDAVLGAKKSRDPLFAFVDAVRFEVDFSNFYRVLRDARPVDLCLRCQGAGCKGEKSACLGTGLLNKSRLNALKDSK